jgi:hypothetical protein
VSTASYVALGCGLACVLLATFVVVRPWRGDLTVKAMTKEGLVSLAAGMELFGISTSFAAILGGPGVITVHLRSREVWRRSIARVSPDAVLEWLDATNEEKSERGGRLKRWLLARTDVAELPELGLRIVFDLRDPELSGAITCGFSDPVATGKTAAWLYPIAGVLAPLGRIDVGFDWSGKTIVDGNVHFSFGVVIARVLRELARFVRHHVRLRVTAPSLPLSSTI